MILNSFPKLTKRTKRKAPKPKQIGIDSIKLKCKEKKFSDNSLLKIKITWVIIKHILIKEKVSEILIDSFLLSLNILFDNWPVNVAKNKEVNPRNAQIVRK